MFKRIKAGKEFESVYKEGKTVLSEDGKIKAKYIIASARGNFEIRYGITVSSLRGNAVWRNKFKRLIRESMKDAVKIYDNTNMWKGKRLLIILSPKELSEKNYKKLFLNDVKPSVMNLFSELRKKL